jgi:hypothetical protein
MAMAILGKIGTKENIADLLPFLEKKEVFQTVTVNQTEIKTELRDVALAGLAQLSGHRLQDYNFAYLKMFANANFNILMSPGMLGFSDDATREAAIKKWKDWYEKEKAKK